MRVRNGIVKWFDRRRGYGFIAQEGGEDVFVHFAVIQMEGYRSLSAGMKVRFELEEGSRGSKARHVWPLKPNR